MVFFRSVLLTPPKKMPQDMPVRTRTPTHLQTYPLFPQHSSEEEEEEMDTMESEG